MACKRKLIDDLDRFVSDLVRRPDSIGRQLHELSQRIDPVLGLVAARDARDVSPGDDGDRAVEAGRRLVVWRERWKGLCGWCPGLLFGRTVPRERTKDDSLTRTPRRREDRIAS